MTAVLTLDRTLNIRFTAAQLATLNDLARRQGLRPSALVRQAVIQRFNLPTDVTNSHETLERADGPNVTPVLGAAPAGAEDGEEAQA